MSAYGFVGEEGVRGERDQPPSLGVPYHMRARMYDPVTGRFTSRDPVWDTNLYEYGKGNPWSYVDPDGRQAGPVLNRYEDTIRVSQTGEPLEGIRWHTKPGAEVGGAPRAVGDADYQRNALGEWVDVQHLPFEKLPTYTTWMWDASGTVLSQVDRWKLVWGHQVPVSHMALTREGWKEWRWVGGSSGQEGYWSAPISTFGPGLDAPPAPGLRGQPANAPPVVAPTPSTDVSSTAAEPGILTRLLEEIASETPFVSEAMQIWNYFSTLGSFGHTYADYVLSGGEEGYQDVVGTSQGLLRAHADLIPTIFSIGMTAVPGPGGESHLPVPSTPNWLRRRFGRRQLPRGVHLQRELYEIRRFTRVRALGLFDPTHSQIPPGKGPIALDLRLIHETVRDRVIARPGAHTWAEIVEERRRELLLTYYEEVFHRKMFLRDLFAEELLGLKHEEGSPWYEFVEAQARAAAKRATNARLARKARARRFR